VAASAEARTFPSPNQDPQGITQELAKEAKRSSEDCRNGTARFRIRGTRGKKHSPLTKLLTNNNKTLFLSRMNLFFFRLMCLCRFGNRNCRFSRTNAVSKGQVIITFISNN
jgi:hypothetical protein